MFGLTIWHWLLVLAVVILVFGSSRLTPLLNQVGRGVGAFRKGIAEGSGPDAKDK